jgi:hypothetical protein
VTNVLPAIALSSLGMGAVFMPLTLIATTGLEDADQGLASGLFNTSQQIGGALGLAVLSTLATSKMPSTGNATSNLVTGFHWAFGAGAVVMVVALGVMVALLRSRHVEQIEAEAASGEPLVVGA